MEQAIGSSVVDLQRRYPGRHGQISALYRLLACPQQPLPSSIHIQDAGSIVSTSRLLDDVLSSAKHHEPSLLTCFVDPLTSTTPQLLWARMSEAFGLGSKRSTATAREPLPLPLLPPQASTSQVPSAQLSDDSIDSFMHLMRSRFQNASHEASSDKVVLVIRRAERMRDLWPDAVTESLYSMAELCNMLARLCIITVSPLGAAHFRSSRPSSARRSPLGAITIPFGRLAKEDVVAELTKDSDAIFAQHCPLNITKDALNSLFKSYASIAYDSFAADVRDLDELRLLTCCVWHPFIQPVLNGEISSPTLQPLILRSAGIFQDALSRLLTRQLSPQEWIKDVCEERLTLRQTKRLKAKGSISTPALAPVATYLLLASFLASYNPARLDVRYFVRDESALLVQTAAADKGGRRRRRKRGGALRRKPQRHARKRGGPDGESAMLLNRQALLGPRPFTYDRLLSIFQALVTESDVGHLAGPGDANASLWELKSKSVAASDAVNSLLRLGLLIRTSAVERLDVTMTLRTNVNHEVATELSKRVQFDLDEWLWDWT